MSIDIENWIPEEGDPIRNMPEKLVTEKDNWNEWSKSKSNERIVSSRQQVLTDKGAQTLLARRLDVLKKATRKVHNYQLKQDEEITVQPLKTVLLKYNFGRGKDKLINQDEIRALDETPW